MDVANRCSSGTIVQSTALSYAIITFESRWISQFWIISTVHTDAAFGKGEFIQMLHHNIIFIRSVPPGCHHKALPMSEHGYICSMFYGCNLLLQIYLSLLLQFVRFVCRMTYTVLICCLPLKLQTVTVVLLGSYSCHILLLLSWLKHMPTF